MSAPTTAQVAANKLQQILAKRKAEQAATLGTGNGTTATPATTASTHAVPTATATATATPVPAPATGAIVWNEEQLRAIELASTGKEFCLIGAAGTGKTTTTKEVIRRALAANYPKVTLGSRWMRVGLPQIVMVSFTNRAVRNLAKAMADIPELIPHCLTIHKLLEYAPVWDTVWDEELGKERNRMQFVPTRDASNPILEVRLCLIDESSMVDTALFAKLKAALPNAKFVFLGDLNQLPPVFGDAILGFKLAELPVVELTKVYRQAMQSPIVAFQHNYTLKGYAPSDTDIEKITAGANGLHFHRIKKNLIDGKRDPESREFANQQMCEAFGKFFEAQHDAGKYVPGEDIILMPFNKGLGTKEMNRHIAQFIGKKADKEVHEVIAGMETHYLAEGDFMVYDKMEWYITGIERNPQYFGKKVPQAPSVNLDRWGALHGARSLVQELEAHEAAHGASNRLERMLDAVGSGTDAEELERAASHIIKMRSAIDPDMTVELSSSGELNALLFGYAITIHKSQGSEWRKVYLFVCKQHAVMLSRELLYTGMTRAREELYVFYDGATATGKKDSSVAKAIKKQDIPGRTWRDKIVYFQGKFDSYKATVDGSIFSANLSEADDQPGLFDDL